VAIRLLTLGKQFHTGAWRNRQLGRMSPAIGAVYRAGTLVYLHYTLGATGMFSRSLRRSDRKASAFVRSVSHKAFETMEPRMLLSAAPFGASRDLSLDNAPSG